MAETERQGSGPLEQRLARLEQRLEELFQHNEVTEVRRNACDHRPQQFDITEADVGYGCSKETAAAKFFDKLLDKVDAKMNCSTSTCGHGDCEAEIIDTAAIEAQLKYNRVRMPAAANCPDDQGWKAFVFNQPNLSMHFNGRCTCVVLV